jgi:hypothetical protein
MRRGFVRLVPLPGCYLAGNKGGLQKKQKSFFSRLGGFVKYWASKSPAALRGFLMGVRTFFPSWFYHPVRKQVWLVFL